MSRFFSKSGQWWNGLAFISLGWTVVPLALMLILAIIAAAVAMQTTFNNLVRARDLTLIEQSAIGLTRTLDLYRVAVARSGPDLLEAIDDPAAATALLAQHRSTTTGLVADDAWLLLDVHGDVIAGYPEPLDLGTDNFATEPFFQAGRQLSQEQAFFYDVTPDGETGRHVVGLAMPLISDEDTFAGLLVTRLYLDQAHFGPHLQGLAADETWQAYLVDRVGRVIYHTKAESIGQDFSSRPEVVALHQHDEAAVGVFESAAGPRILAGYAPLGTTGWGVVISEPWSALTGPVRNALLYIGVTLVIGVVGLTLIVLWAVQRITNRLQVLAHQTSQVATGTYDEQVTLSRISELRELGMAFNAMVQQLASYRGALQEYVASVTDSQEEERKRIARDLHDGTIQTLIAIGQRIELARDALAEQSIEESRRQLTDLRTMVTETIDGIRQFTRDLRPLTLEDLGLIPALHYLLSRLEQDEGIAVDLQIEGEAVGLSQDLEVSIYRIVQEALSNIRKHAQAAQVWVTVRFLPRQTIVEIRDNGIGFDVPKDTTDLARRGSFGLMGLEERAHLFGGDLILQSAPGQGAAVKVILPHAQLPRRRQAFAETASDSTESLLEETAALE